MKIPTGNFGNVIASPAPMVNVPRAAFDTGDGLQRAGATLAAVGNEGLRLIAQEEQQKRKEAQDLARVEAGNLLLDRENSIKSLHVDIEEKLSTGEIRHDQAKQYYENGLKALPGPTVEGLDPVGMANFQKGLKRVDLSGVAGVQVSAERARKVEFKSAIDKMLDNLGKAAGQPGADINQINAQLDALEQGRIAYGANWEQVKQGLKDKNWTNNATQRAIDARDNLDALRQLEQDLTAEDGFYAGKLDTDKRNALLSTVINSKSRIEGQMQHLADKRETVADSVIKQIEKQNFSGLPPTPEMVAAWTEQVKGTSKESEIGWMLEQGVQVQQLLMLPPQERDSELRKLEAELRSTGGDVAQLEKIDKLRAISENADKEMAGEPLVFLGKRTGVTPNAINFMGEIASGNTEGIKKELQDRVWNLQVMKKQFGEIIPLKPLLGSEIAQLQAGLKSAGPETALQLFDTIHSTIGDADAYQGAMRQLAPDSPVSAMAGALYGEHKKYTTPGGVFSSESEVTVSGKKAAEYILKGESLLNPSKDSAAANNTKLFMPKEADLRMEFDSKVGAAFAGHPEAANVAYQAMRAAYAGMAAERGITSPDSDLVSKAIDQVTGGIVDFHGTQVIPPYGMPDDVFIDKVTTQFNEKAKSAGMNTNWGAIKNFTIYPVGNNRYGFSNGTEPLPFTVDLNQ
jgi:hypothetical protein